MPQGHDILIICGVSGSGKSTIAKALATEKKWRFVEGDEHHPESNIEKMSAGTPLSDFDRTAWLDSICTDLKLNANQVNVLACSALTPYVQDFLASKFGEHIVWIKLEISQTLATQRMETRDHFMPPSLMQSQFEAWQPPSSGLNILADQSIDDIVKEVLEYLKLKGS